MKSERRTLKFLTIVLAALLLPGNQAFAFQLKNQSPPYGEGVVINGYARVPANSFAIYTETYLDDPLTDNVRATYWSSSRELIAYKKVNYRPNSDTPDYFEAYDYRRRKGFRMTVKGDVANVKVVRTAKNNFNREKIILDKDVELDDNTVIDASFHRLVLKHWDRLLSGKSVRVKFLQIDKARLIPLKVKKTRCDTEGSVCFKATLDNFILGAVLPSISMKYEIATQRVIRYTGLGPIAKKTGKGLAVNILYEYLY